MCYIEGNDRRQMQLLSLESMIGPDNPVRFIDLMCRKFYTDNPDLLNAGDKSIKNIGRKAYHPVLMMNLLVYGYFNSIPSSRKMEKATHRNIEVMWLVNEIKPDHWTICAFRRENKETLKELIKCFRLFLVEHKYADRENIVIDGSRMKAYASRDMLSKKGIEDSLQNVEQSINDYLERIEILDEHENELNQIHKEKEDVRAEIEEMKQSITKLEKKKIRLEQANELLAASGRDRIAPNDLDATLQKNRNGMFAGYNVQTGVDEQGHFIMHTTTSTKTNDQNLLNENIDAFVDTYGSLPKEVTADKGYGTAVEILKAEQSGVNCFVPTTITQREKDEKKGIIFIYDEENDYYTCSNGKKLTLYCRNIEIKKGTGEYADKYKCHECEGCPLREKCTKSKTGRTLKRKHTEKQIQAYKDKIKTKYAREKIRKRKQIVEHPFGTIKMLMGKFNFLLTTKEKVEIEVDLWALVYNIKRLLNVNTYAQLKEKVLKYSWKLA